MLSWISDGDLLAICKKLVDDTRTGTSDTLNFRNIVDPFSAVFDLAINDLTFDEWVKNEITRQRQKTLQNKIGEFHQNVLGKIKGWENLHVGEVVDLVNKKKRIIAEVKNKFNTVKGSDKIGVFNRLAHALNYGYRGFTAYYVPILTKHRVDESFVPSDNETGGRPAENPRIREMDGESFYTLATGSKTALADLYRHLPSILADITGANAERIVNDPWFMDLFRRATEK